MEQLDYEELIMMCKENDSEAFNELYRRFYPVAYRLAYHITNSDADAHDASQETMIAVFNYLDSLREPKYFPLWLKRIVVAKCNRIFRKNKHVVYTDDETSLMTNAPDTVGEHNPKYTMHFQNDKEVLDFFIHMLPKSQADVMQMYYFQQLSIKEIAAKLNLPVGTIKTRMHTSKKKLKEHIMDYEKKEEIALDFQSEGLLASLGAGSLFLKFYDPSKMGASSLSIGKMLVIACVGVGTITGAAAVINNQKNANQDMVQNRLLADKKQAKEFTNVNVGTTEITNPQDAYFKLILWADNKQKMKDKSQEERKEIKSLLDSLREYGGYYNDLLEKEGWIAAFEEII